MNETTTDELIRKASSGDERATQELLERHRSRLKRLVNVRMDDRLQARVDPSDIVQETLFEASKRLVGYLESQPIAFYPWLRQIAAERLDKIYRRHVTAQKRSVNREAAQAAISQFSSQMLARHFLAAGTSPSGRVMQEERRRRVQQALAELGDSDREILVLRHLEHLSIGEIAAVLEITESAAKSRHFRAIQRIHELLGNEG